MAYIGKQPTPVPLSASDLDDDIVSLAKMASGTDGNLITYDTSGNPVAVATGDDGQVLTSAGAGQPCAFEAAAGGGKIGQVVSATKTDVFYTTSTTLVDVTDITVDITPAATSSKILVLVDIKAANETAGYGSHFSIIRDSTSIYKGDAAGSSYRDSWGYFMSQANREIAQGGLHFLDSPSTTSSTTYKLQCRTETSGTIYVNYQHAGALGNTNTYNNRMASSITVMEVLA